MTGVDGLYSPPVGSRRLIACRVRTAEARKRWAVERKTPMVKKKIPREFSKGISRRDFARRAALAAATAAMIPSDLLARPEAPATLAPQEVQGPKLSPEALAEVEAKIQAIFGKYGQRLSEEQKADVRRLVAEGQKALETLRAFPLDNSDAPATVFELYPKARPIESRPARRQKRKS